MVGGPEAAEVREAPAATATPGGVPAAEPTWLASGGSLFLPLDVCGEGYKLRGPLHVGKLDRKGCLNAIIPGPLVHIGN